MAIPATTTTQDIITALTKRMTTQGFLPSPSQVLTLALDVMNVCNTDNANVVAHSATEVATNPPRPFRWGV